MVFHSPLFTIFVAFVTTFFIQFHYPQNSIGHRLLDGATTRLALHRKCLVERKETDIIDALGALGQPINSDSDSEGGHTYSLKGPFEGSTNYDLATSPIPKGLTDVTVEVQQPKEVEPPKACTIQSNYLQNRIVELFEGTITKLALHKKDFDELRETTMSNALAQLDQGVNSGSDSEGSRTHTKETLVSMYIGIAILFISNIIRLLTRKQDPDTKRSDQVSPVCALCSIAQTTAVTAATPVGPGLSPPPPITPGPETDDLVRTEMDNISATPKPETPRQAIPKMRSAQPPIKTTRRLFLLVPIHSTPAPVTGVSTSRPMPPGTIDPLPLLDFCPAPVATNVLPVVPANATPSDLLPSLKDKAVDPGEPVGPSTPERIPVGVPHTDSLNASSISEPHLVVKVRDRAARSNESDVPCDEASTKVVIHPSQHVSNPRPTTPETKHPSALKEQALPDSPPLPINKRIEMYEAKTATQSGGLKTRRSIGTYVCPGARHASSSMDLSPTTAILGALDSNIPGTTEALHVDSVGTAGGSAQGTKRAEERHVEGEKNDAGSNTLGRRKSMPERTFGRRG